jgi:hypothetical protein
MPSRTQEKDPTQEDIEIDLHLLARGVRILDGSASLIGASNVLLSQSLHRCPVRGICNIVITGDREPKLHRAVIKKGTP